MTTWTDGPAGDRFRDADRRMREALAGLEEITARVEAESSARGDERAAAARRGDLGPDWQRVQMRVDLGQTTLDDVFGGKDPSPEAERLRGAAREHLAVGAQEAEQRPDGPAAELRGEAAALHERLEALLAQAADLSRQYGGLGADSFEATPVNRMDAPLDPRYLWEPPQSPSDHPDGPR